MTEPGGGFTRADLDRQLDDLRYEWGESPTAQAMQESLTSMMPEG